MRLKQARIAPLSDAEMSDEQREAIAPLAQNGPPLNIFRTLVRAPKALTRFNEWGGYILSRRNSLPAREREIVILRVGFLCKSGYEFTQHTRIGLAEGLTQEEVAAIKVGATASNWTSADVELIRMCDELVKDHFVSDDLDRPFGPVRRKTVHGRGVHRRPIHPGLHVPEHVRRTARSGPDPRS